MGIIKPLPEHVRSSVRAGVVLFDVARVVEELVFNSLDAGASKISIFIGIGTSYVKVVDDGFGITRDGLVLLGERYVTSKFHDPVDMDAKGRSFGFRGEALASISDVSLVEIITKACGSANGYRKVMKGSKCLYIGIDDDREEVGTTVVVRDLFYNQPVRRKCMQSSPKKVLHAVKRCVLRIAVVQPKVSFKLVDSESESNLLCTYPCSSPLSLLRSSFGSEVSSSLHELKIGDGNLKLSGYISSPFDSFAIKADHGIQTRKRSRSQVNPAYVLNLDCPRSLYDLSFESSKIFVHFKDWTPILTFIEEAIQQFWKEKYVHGELLVDRSPMVKGDNLWKDGDKMVPKGSENVQPMKKSRMHGHQDLIANLYSPSEMLSMDGDLLLHKLHDKEPCENLHRSSIELDAQQIKMDFSHQAEHFLESWDTPLAKCSTLTVQNNNEHPWVADNYFVSEEFPKRCGENVQDNIFRTVWKEQSPKMHIDVINKSAGSIPFSDFHEFSYDDDNYFKGTTPFLRGCSSGRCFPLEEALSRSDELKIENDIIKGTQLLGVPHDEVDVLKLDSNIQGSYFCAGTSWKEKGLCSLTPPKVNILGISQNFNFLSKDFAQSGTGFQDQFPEEKISSSDLNKKVQSFLPSYQTISSPYSPLISSTMVATDWEVDPFIFKDEIGRAWTSGDRTPFRDSVDPEEKCCEFNYDILLKKSNVENRISSCIHNTLITDGFFYGKQDLGTSLERPNEYKHFSSRSPDMHTHQTDCFIGRLHRSHYEKAYESPKHQFGDKGFKQGLLPIERSRRSLSAPPHYRRKTTFYSLGLRKAEKVNASIFLDDPPHLVDSRHLKNFSGSSNLFVKPCPVNPADDSLIGTRVDTKKLLGITGDEEEKHIGDISKHARPFDVKVTAPALELCSKETQESSDSWIKWKNCCPLKASNDQLQAVDEQNSILDISSGFLSLAGNSLIPESIDKNFLEDAKVLLQLDKKFIPVVSDGILAVIDQHAADERIRLEDLRQKLLSGEEKTIAYLDAERELMLPEIGYQLLYNYADQVKEWGWICNIHSQDSKSFRRNLNTLHEQEKVIMLMAVPCILGVNLSDLDLLEFLHQLADTDGSSTMPPAVLRVLNSKACRGAIMFGDCLLPSECSLIVEELKQTSLCFQCAHGRPTTVPLVNLEALHKQIRELGLSDDSRSNGAWHGLRQHELSLERTLQRLGSAECL